MRPASLPVPTVAVLAPYTGFWESASPTSLRAHLEGLLEDVSRRLGEHATVAEATVVGSREDGAAAGDRLRATGTLDAVVVLQAMAVMPAFTLTALALLPGLPLVVWAAQSEHRLRPGFDHAAITQEGATVGVPMLTNPLVRAGRPFELVVGRTDDDRAYETLRSLLRAAAAARRVRHARVGLVGAPLDGYDCVAIDPGSLRKQLGVELVAIAPGEVLERWRAIDGARVASLRAETAALYAVDPLLGEDALERTLRAACALEDLTDAHRLDAGAMNCHVPEIRLGPEIGIAPCFGLGRLTSAGVPWSCAGDVPVAIAMLLLKALGGAAAYHELEALDAVTGEFVLANTGEHDLAFGDGARPVLTANRWFALDPACGACACLTAPAGPATLLGFAELDVPQRAYRFVVAPGTFTQRTFPEIATPTAAFRFSSGPAAEAWTRWCRAGVSHHSAATPGDLADAIGAAGRFLGAEVISV